MSIQIQQINKRFGSQQVLNNISFSIKSGEIVGFLGPNGAGKSTTMKIITGYLFSDSGKVTVCNVDVEKNPIDARRLIGYLPEHNPLYLDLYVREYLQFIARLYGFRKNVLKTTEQIIERTGLSPESNKKIGALSKGFRQRVGLAQALIHDPQVLILDEPTTGLDPNQLADIRSLIKEIGKEKTVLFSTHIMQEVEAVCDRVIVINKGTIVADENECNIIQSFSRETILTYVEFANPVSEKELYENFELTSISCIKPGAFQLESKKDIRKELFLFAVKQNYIILSMNRSEKDMEQIFRELTTN